MTRAAKGAAKAAPRPRSGIHTNPRRQLSATRAELELWDEAAAHADGISWAEWARHVLTLAAADELEREPLEVMVAVRRATRGAGS